MTRWRPVLCCLLLAACQQPATLGATCSRPSDCPTPLSCSLGRCHAACRTSADCPVATRCVLAPEGAVCTLDVENHCDGHVCPAPLTCMGDECRSLCRASSDCVSGVCTAGACVEPRAGDDAAVAAPDAASIDAGNDSGTDAEASDGGTDAGCSACAYRRCTASGACDDAIALALGAQHLCIVRAGGTVVCDGNDDAGQLGDTGMVTPWTPVLALLVSTATSIVASDGSTCALLRDHTVRCWGIATGIGNGSGVGSREPVATTAVGVVHQLAAGGSTTCALHDAGNVSCWGDDNANQCGDGGSGSPRYSPVATVPPISNALGIAAGAGHACVLGGDASVSCWGRCEVGQCGDAALPAIASSPRAVSGLASDAVQIVVGGNHGCVRYASGGVACWGSGTAGELGYGGFGDQATAHPVTGLSDAVDLCAGASHTCAVRVGGEVMCWGRGDHGALGDGLTMSHPVPVAAVISGVARITCANQSTCALRHDGSVWCWGWNQWDMMMSGMRVNGRDVMTPTRIDALP